MASPLPDHWAALGVDRTADAATIKKTYRKLVLSCHPDKVQDEALKEQKAEEFHKIQQAYEVLSDDDRRSTYEAELKLEQLRKEKLARTGAAANTDTKSTRFDSRASSGAYPANTSSQRYTTEERRPSRGFDEDRYYDGRRKYDGEDAYARSSPPSRAARPEKESSARAARPTPDRTRSDRNKTRDREDRRDRKFVSVESESSDEKARYEAEWKRRNAEEEARNRRSAEEEARTQAAEARRKVEEQRRSYEDSRYDSTSRKLSQQAEEALRYQHRSRADVQAEIRPSPVRTASRDYYTSERGPSRREVPSRPEPVRRSSARPKERPVPSGRERERGMPEIVEWGEDRRPPLFKHSSSSPADIQLPRSMPQRSFTGGEPLPRDHRRGDSSPPPTFSRSSTMPTGPSSSSRRKDTTARPSTLRETMTPEHSPEHDHPSTTKTKHYYYPTPSGGVPLRPDDMSSASTHRTTLREPDHYRQRSPSPLTRPPIGPNRHESQYSTAGIPPPPMGRSNSSRNVSPVRGRQQPPLYGEMNSDHARRENARRQTSFSPHDVAYTKKIGPDDVRWAPKEGGTQRGEREYASKPSLGRTATCAARRFARAAVTSVGIRISIWICINMNMTIDLISTTSSDVM
ncbi:DnaJ-domain-containing protein [Dothidotthia symphoricarpi CBS 119687]|uniref:DnaJ-domain-containing protein n=1 Tax=Dothidotthia symphoricarpi CBS 119687 TaxID=1392245 RepID=A0A6A6A448_9PLEO|nr:DnaJ-domain-containing protein [Dothidotthia symphoricarpi CBS 119687]KAF2125923.1 DnaJ-domain-containing protein [Dothidotthia symphoricarpi CBS 119687]